MDFVDEKKRPLPGFPPGAGFVEHFLELRNAGEDRGDLLEVQRGFVGQKPRNRGLAGARRPPEDQRAERARLQHARERAVRADQGFLPDHFR